MNEDFLTLTAFGVAIAGWIGGIFYFAASSSAGLATEANQRDWIESNIEENYTVSEVEVSFDESIPAPEDEKKQFFEIEGFSDDLHDRVVTQGYLNFDEQVVIIGNDADGVFLPVEGSDAERVLTATTESGA